MTSLDLRIRPPRSPREQLDGLVFMPRTIDKIRATLPGGHLGPYHITPGMSQMLLTIVGVELPALRDAVFRANTDDDVAAWLRTHANVAQYERANVVLTEWRHEHIPQEHRAHFESLYPEYLLGRYPVAFDLIEADDRELYPTLGKR
jgi:Domain of unknown function (DUF5069)